MRAARALSAAGLAAVFATLPAGAEAPPAPPLPTLAANISETSVSGISSGAYMAGQFQIAHSRIVAGAGIIAGGPYGCEMCIRDSPMHQGF